MKIFIVGLPKSGRTTVSKALANNYGWQYIDAMSWARSTFRAPLEDEHPHQYEDEYQQYLTEWMKSNPNFIIDRIAEIMKLYDNTSVFIIDGVSSPRDFTVLFDYRKDVIVFLNRTDNNHDFRDHENIGTSVIRDYCFWMSSHGLLPKNRWIEYNFKIPGEDSETIKKMGAQNSVFIVKSIKMVISHLSVTLKEIVDAISG